MNQEAIKELSEKREFCKIYILKKYEKKKKENIEELLKWAKGEEKNSFTIKYISYVFIASNCNNYISSNYRKIPITYLLLVFDDKLFSY